MTEPHSQGILHTLHTLDERMSETRIRWDHYRGEGTIESFLEFTIALNSLAEYLNRLRLSGLVRVCEELENASLELLGDATLHPLLTEQQEAIEQQVNFLLEAIKEARQNSHAGHRRFAEPEMKAKESEHVEWIKPRSVWIVSSERQRDRSLAISERLGYFGFRVDIWPWSGTINANKPPLAVIFITEDFKEPTEGVLMRIQRIRKACPTSQLFCLGTPPKVEAIVTLIRAGLDGAIPVEDEMTAILNRLLDLVQNIEQEKYRVLIVEDSRVAVASIRRALADNGIESSAINDPVELIDAVESYAPDLVLMDMYMPHFNGVEATRALRLIKAGQTLPVVYLSGESNVALQVEALRLGGDQFLTKPFNPVLLAAVVKTTIERNRATLRTSRLDSLTGLLNHTSAKERLDQMLANAQSKNEPLNVIMLDIDLFKKVNDTHGHPAGDRVIQGLAWLLKGRLRAGDLVGRYGGEEFLLALPGATPDQICKVIDQIRSRFEALPHLYPGGVLYATFSAGIAAYPQTQTAFDLISRADMALLEAKRQGRNRVELYNDSLRPI